ncbi:hypothetical protein HK101_000384, partial [Irineochytrium annulatum]
MPLLGTPTTPATPARPAVPVPARILVPETSPIEPAGRILVLATSPTSPTSGLLRVSETPKVGKSLQEGSREAEVEGADKLTEVLAAYSVKYDIPAVLLQHGLQLLGVVVDVPGRLIRLSSQTHLTGVTASLDCQDCTYLKVDGAPPNFQAGLPELVIKRDAIKGPIYAGQTRSVLMRERGQRLPDHHLCLLHDVGGFDLDCAEMASIALCKILFGDICRNKSPLGKRVYYRNEDGSWTAFPSFFIGLPFGKLSVANLPRAVILGTAPPAWSRRPSALHGLPPTRVVPVRRSLAEDEGPAPALARCAGDDTIPFYNEYPDAVSSKSDVEFAKLMTADIDRAWAGVCSLKAVQGANVVARTGFRP